MSDISGSLLEVVGVLGDVGVYGDDVVPAVHGVVGGCVSRGSPVSIALPVVMHKLWPAAVACNPALTSTLFVALMGLAMK